jgi:hypothetical protein
MKGIQRTASPVAVILCLAVVSTLLACSFQSRPPEVKATDVVSITVWVRDEATWYLERSLNLVDQPEIEQFVEAWATLATLRPPSNPESPDGIIEVEVSLSGFRHWTLKWQPAYGEAVFRLFGTGTPEMMDRSPIKLRSEEMLQLLQEWLGSSFPEYHALYKNGG